MQVFVAVALTVMMTGLGASATAASEAVPATDVRPGRTAPPISVRLHDYAGLPDEELHEVQDLVSEIYQAIDVAVEWRQPVHAGRVQAGVDEWPGDPVASLSVLILPPAMARRIGIKPDVSGYAAVNATEGGSVAFVVADRTARIAACAHLPHATVISTVIAHELGHLLMPARAHSRNTLMRAHWDPDDFRRGASRRFSKAEADIIRRTIVRRAAPTQPAN